MPISGRTSKGVIKVPSDLNENEVVELPQEDILQYQNKTQVRQSQSAYALSRGVKYQKIQGVTNARLISDD